MQPPPGLPRLPEHASRLRQFFHGLVVSGWVLRALLAHRRDRRRYLRVTALQTLATVLLAIPLLPLYAWVSDAGQKLEARAESLLQQTLGDVETRLANAVQRRETDGEEATDGSAFDEAALAGVFAAAAQDFRSEVEALRLAREGPSRDLEHAAERRERARDEAEARRDRELELAAEQRERELDEAEARRERELELAAEQRERTLDEAEANRERALAEAERAREQAEEIRDRVLEQNERLREQAAQHPAADLADARRLHEQAMRAQARAIRELERSAELIARQAALEATEALGQTPLPSGSVEELRGSLATLQERFAVGREDESEVGIARRAEDALQIAIEATFLREAAQEERRRLRSLRREAGMDPAAATELEARIAEANALAANAGALRGQARAEAKVALKRVAIAEADLAPAGERVAQALTGLSPEAKTLVSFGALYTVLYLVQFLVIGFSRDYHDQLSRRAFLVTGLVPEDPELRPRVHFDWRWMRRRLQRRWRALKLFALGLPVIYLATWPLPRADVARSVLLTVWAGYWFIVFVAAKSARAWVDEGLAPDPWFLRPFAAVARRVRVLGRGPFRLYGWLWRRHGRNVFAPAECVEQQPWAFAGIAVVRFLGTLPILKLFLRPLTPVAVAHLLEVYREQHPPRVGRDFVLVNPDSTGHG